MLRFEIRKVLSRPAGRIILALLTAVLAAVCYFAVCSEEYVDEDGNTATGIRAVRTLRDKRMEWAGALTEDVLAEVIRQNRLINASEEYRSDDVQEQNKAYAKKQGFCDIRDMINRSFCNFREYDYYRADSVTEEEVGQFYENRILKLTQWLNSEEAKYMYSEEEKQFLTEQFQRLETPLYYEYSDGWTALLEYAPTIIMLLVLLTGFLVSGIFSNEFQWKADAIFFSARYGRDRAVAAKVGAGFCLVTAIYWTCLLIYSAAVLGILGTEGAGCAIQASFGKWKSFYNITFWEAYLLTIFGGYMGSLFILSLTMLVSARTHSSVLAVAVPFILIFLPSFTGSFSVLSDVLGLLPDQLLQIGTALSYFNLYRIGGRIFGEVPVIMVLYSILCLFIPPVLYRVYRKTEIK